MPPDSNSGECPTDIPESARIDCWPGGGASESGCEVNGSLYDVFLWCKEKEYISRMRDVYGVRATLTEFLGAFSIRLIFPPESRTTRELAAYQKGASAHRNVQTEDVFSQQ